MAEAIKVSMLARLASRSLSQKSALSLHEGSSAVSQRRAVSRSRKMARRLHLLAI